MRINPVVKLLLMSVIAALGLCSVIIGNAISNNWWSLFGLLFLVAAVLVMLVFAVKYSSDNHSAFTYLYLFGALILAFSSIGLCIVVFRASNAFSLAVFLPNLFGFLTMIAAVVIYFAFEGKPTQDNSIPDFFY
ncbi:uncharacterized protein MONOS_11324 [Monocercomonoides exilis]|uniref:uncharacterized protein n=1 Tax=Monocercomonoides exilis TaxID=2049356 RepID=UPI00355A796B|nr:hypothetical protein MONOS_11324 [Monocercomonoides exilis]|eukprot:MONOS_11324.1-p1 / transcript=MONOS_11324.1 / gene=MONOS_11324 / organism=Monocercomonoides_exilis_PA203 / gene_product=unspecified product / transcript_product=unspecified product / location=Mono_scaffold00563:5500-6098(-) / protein_length=133 / sequence_SO=supercontig / SO=protein_coding / is_pseudo=false